MAQLFDGTTFDDEGEQPRSESQRRVHRAPARVTYRGFASFSESVAAADIERQKKDAKGFGMLRNPFSVSPSLCWCDFTFRRELAPSTRTNHSAHQILAMWREGGVFIYTRCDDRLSAQTHSLDSFLTPLFRQMLGAAVVVGREWVRYERRARPIRGANASSAMRGRASGGTWESPGGSMAARPASLSLAVVTSWPEAAAIDLV